ncbi:MAG: peptide chain release factor N(5)-glutamine methyltransferase [Clostridiales bacterium]|nr:peptide chain release factor N(5)-glutamine methyltransferase [Clostridiales bacterium]
MTSLLQQQNIPLFQAMRAVSAALLPVAGEESDRETRILFADALNIKEGALLLNKNEPLPDAAKEKILSMVERRLTGEPLQYILGEWEFMGLPFKVDSRALIPRQDTETLAEAAIALLKKKTGRRVLDMCCGTGCIGISLAVLAGAEVTLADISADALALARENAAWNGINAAFVETDLFSAIKGEYDLIVSNPPYISAKDMETLQKEVRFEPPLALYGGEDGLDLYRRIAADYKAYLAPGGAILLEVGAGEAGDVKALLGEGAYSVKDLCGIDRVVIKNEE